MYKPVRKIDMTSRSVSGVVPLMGEFESALERDLMEMLRFDAGIKSFTAQPLTIKYQTSEGKVANYTPDGLVHFNDDVGHPPMLYEVKYRQDFRKDWKALLPKFRAAKKFCSQQGWLFKVFTENEIRITYLQNAKFLWTYRSRLPSQATINFVMNTLWDLDETDADMLLCALCKSKSNRGELIPVIWHLISLGKICCDLNQPITMSSKIWPVRSTT